MPRRGEPSCPRGMTLAETMVTSAVFFLTIMIASNMLVQTWAAFGKGDRATVAVQRARVAFDRIGLVLRQAEKIQGPQSLLDGMDAGRKAAAAATSLSGIPDAAPVSTANLVLSSSAPGSGAAGSLTTFGYALSGDTLQEQEYAPGYDPANPATQVITRTKSLAKGVSALQMTIDPDNTALVAVQLTVTPENSPPVSLETTILRRR